jgi:hypothetical protein
MHILDTSLSGQHKIRRRIFERQNLHEALVCSRITRSGERVGLRHRRLRAT